MLEVLDSHRCCCAAWPARGIPAVVAHGEGRACFDGAGDPGLARVALRYVAPDGGPAEAFPANPNGSDDAVAGLCSDDGRVTLLMPHPERTLRRDNFSWAPEAWGEDSPWLRMFRNARVAVG